MWFRSFFGSVKPRSARALTRQTQWDAASRRPRLEPLEDRCLLSFFPAVSYPGASPVVADFNVDGVLDLLGTLGNGDGTFRQVLTGGGGEAVTDFNLDGWPDVAGPGSVGLFLGNGDGTFEQGGFVGIGLSIAEGDLDNDGKPDAVTGWMGDPESGVLTTLFIHPGNGDGTFAPPQQVNIPGVWGEPWSVTVADIDSDGLADVVLASETSGGNDYTVTVMRGAGGIANLPGYGSRFSGFTNSLAIADVDRDNHPDIISTIESTGEVLVNLGLGNGEFAGPVAFAAGAAPQSPAVADVNGDHLPDLVIANAGWWDGFDYVGKGVSVLMGRGNGAFDAPVRFVTSGPIGDVGVGDFNGDGHIDLAAAGTFWDGNTPVYSCEVLINDGIWNLPPPSPPSVSIGDVTITEGNTGTRAANFTVTLSASSDLPVTVVYTTADGTATGSDYHAASGTLTFAPHQTRQVVQVLVTGDRLGEPNESFAVNLNSPTNATVADGQGVGTILDDEPRISINDIANYEGRKGKTTLFTFTVTLSAAYDQAVTVSFRTADGSAKTSDSDYVAKSGTLTFAPGQTTKTITIEVRGDSKREANETFVVDLTGLSSNALFTNRRGIGTILNDD